MPRLTSKTRSQIKDIKPLVITVLLLLITVGAVSTRTSLFRLFTKASVGSTSSELAAAELSVIKPIYNFYLRDVSNLSDTYGGLLKNNPSNSGLFRTLGSEMTLAALAGSDDAAVQKVVDHFNNYFISSNLSPTADHTVGAVGLDLLVGLNLNRRFLIPAKYSEYMIAIKNLADGFYSVLTAGGIRSAAAFYELTSGNAGDTKGEESAISAAFFALWAKIAPGVGPGAISDLDRLKFTKAGDDLYAFTFSQCASGCAFKSGTWLAANHGEKPSAHYTLSILMAAGDMNMIYNQLATPLSDVIISKKSAVNSVASAMDAYITDKFRFTGKFDFINADGTVYDSFNYDNRRYTLKGDSNPPTTSSIPTDQVDSINFWRESDSAGNPTSTLKAYVLKDNSMWHYLCDLTKNPISCRVLYRMDNVSTAWSSQSDPNKYWANYPLPPKVDAHTSWYPTKSPVLNSFLWSGNRVWSFTCSGGVCTHQPTYLLSELYAKIKKVRLIADDNSWLKYPPPVDAVDGVSQFIDKNTLLLKSYLFRGGRVWYYTCSVSSTGITSNCTEGYTKSLASFWSTLDVTKWNIAPPTAGIDDMTQYYLPSGVLKTFFTRGNLMWSYDCDSAGCRPVDVKKLANAWNNISRQYVWVNPEGSGQFQYLGVSDWGTDATYFNNSFAGVALLNPLRMDKYRRLLDYEISQGRTSKTAFPSEFSNGLWKFSPVSKISSTALAGTGYLSDGMDLWNSRIPPAYSINDYVSSHWWLNVYDGRNHAYAYLALAPSGKLKQFAPLASPVPVVSLPASKFTLKSGAKGKAFIRGTDTLSSPPDVSNSDISLSNSAKAYAAFTVPACGSYLINGQVSAPNGSQNSFYASVDTEPTDPAGIWDILPTVGYTSRYLANRGSGTPEASQYNPKAYQLCPDKPHTLIIGSREGSTSFQSMAVYRLSP